MSLTAAQSSAYDEIQAWLGSISNDPVLIHGNKGAGKRMICIRIADDLGLSLLPVDASRSNSQLMSELSLVLEELSSDTALVVIDNLDRLDESNATLIHSLCAQRRFDAGVSVSPDSPIIGLHHTSRSPKELGLSHPSLTSFRARVQVGSFVDEDDILSILSDTCRESNVSIENGAAKISSLPILPIRKNPAAVVLFAQDVVALSAKGMATETALRESCRRSWDRWLSRLKYKGGEVTHSRYETWLCQFPPESHLALARLAEALVDEYYVDETQYWEQVELLARQSGVPDWSNVWFCRWQDQGESAPEIARDLKGRAKWNVVGEIDLERPETWPGPEGDKSPALMVDDFVGSGTQLAGGLDRLLCAAHAMPEREFVVALLSGFEEGLAYALAHLDPMPTNVRVARARSYKSQDSCLADDSRVLTDASERCIVEGISEDLGRRLGIQASRRLGWGELASLVVFPRFLPNTNLPLMWFDSKPDYQPLIPRSGW